MCSSSAPVVHLGKFLCKQRILKFEGGHEYVSRGRREETRKLNGKESHIGFQETKRSKAVTKGWTFILNLTLSAFHSRDIANVVEAYCHLLLWSYAKHSLVRP